MHHFSDNEQANQHSIYSNKIGIFKVTYVFVFLIENCAPTPVGFFSTTPSLPFAAMHGPSPSPPSPFTPPTMHRLSTIAISSQAPMVIVNETPRYCSSKH